MKDKIRILKTPTGYQVSSRFLFINFDLSWIKGGKKFLQFGKRPVKFISYASKHPMIIRSIGWKTIYTKFKFKFGTTRKPIDFSTVWIRDTNSELQHRGTGIRASSNR